MKVFNDKKENLLMINRARKVFNQDFKEGIITEKSILEKMNEVYTNSLKNKNKYDYKEKLLNSIYNAPFIMLDQDDLNLSIKSEIYYFIAYRFIVESKELFNQYKTGQITLTEYKEEIDLIRFRYFESTNEGKELANNLINSLPEELTAIGGFSSKSL